MRFILMICFLLCLNLVNTAYAQVSTWQEANKEYARLLDEADAATETDEEKLLNAAEFARLAAELYPEQSKAYKVQNHFELVEMAIEATLRAQGSDALPELYKSNLKSLAAKAGPKDPYIIVLRQELAQTYARIAEGSKVDREYKLASAQADEIWGENDPRAILILSEWGHAGRLVYGGNWAKRKLKTAKERAITHGEDNLLALRIDLYLAKLELELKREGAAIKAYRDVVEKLEARDDMDPTLLQQSIIQLAYAYNEEEDEDGLNEMMSRLAQTYEGQTEDILPMIRVSPKYPDSEAHRGGEGVVVVEFAINEFGKPEDIHVFESNGGPAFEKAAIEAVRKWRYRPALINGEAERYEGVKTQLTFVLK